MFIQFISFECKGFPLKEEIRPEDIKAEFLPLSPSFEKDIEKYGSLYKKNDNYDLLVQLEPQESVFIARDQIVQIDCNFISPSLTTPKGNRMMCVEVFLKKENELPNPRVFLMSEYHLRGIRKRLMGEAI